METLSVQTTSAADEADDSNVGISADSSAAGTSSPEGFEWGNGSGEVPPGQNVDEDGTIINNGGNTPPGLNRREKPDKGDNPNRPEKPSNPGTEDKSDRNADKAQQGTHIYTYDELNRMVSSNIAKTLTAYTYDTLGNLTYEKVKNRSVDYQYNELNQPVYRQDSRNQTYTYACDLRGNRIAETGKKESREYVYDETNRLVEGTNWKGDKSAYTCNGLGVRINNIHTTHSGSVYDRDYVIDYTSLERDDLMVYAEGNGQLEYVQREVYAGSERIEQFTDRSRGGYERLLYVHEDLQGNTRYYTKATGQSFAELTYDAWGMPESPNKLLNNDHGNYVYATYTGHIFDTTLDIYFCEARFYDASTRTWMAMDPVKDGGNWYQYCQGNPIVYMDPDGLFIITIGEVLAVGALLSRGKGVQFAIDMKTGDIGVFSFTSWGGASPSLSKGISISVYFTENIENLAGLSYAYGAGINGPVIGGIPFKGSLEVSYGWASDGSLVRGITVSGPPLDLIPVEFHAVEVHTQQLLSGNLIEMAKNAAYSIIRVFKKVAGYFDRLIGCM